jgi:diguanylate cyclase (GGDEF)-like protein
MEKEERQRDEEIKHYEAILKLRNAEIMLLNEMSGILQRTTAMDQVYAVIGEFAEKLLPGIMGALYLFSDSRKLLEVGVSWGTNLPGEKMFEADGCWSLKQGRMHIVDDPRARICCRHIGQVDTEEEFLQYLCVPLIARGTPLGIINLVAEPGVNINDWTMLATSIAGTAALAVSNLRLREQLEVQAIIDSRTGLFKSHFTDKMLEREMNRAIRHKRSLVTVHFEVDPIKPINNFFNHYKDDNMITDLCHFVEGNIRSEDIACSYGDDGFTLILPETSVDKVHRRIEDLRRKLKEITKQYSSQSAREITVSAGAAGFPENGTTTRELILATDNALRRAKDSGRDQVMLAGQP